LKAYTFSFYPTILNTFIPFFLKNENINRTISVKIQYLENNQLILFASNLYNLFKAKEVLKIGCKKDAKFLLNYLENCSLFY